MARFQKKKKSASGTKVFGILSILGAVAVAIVIVMSRAGNLSAQVLPPPICGNGSVETGEQCDDRNPISEDGCSAQCRTEYCGDRVIQTRRGEICDDGNFQASDGCNHLCRRETCGDGIIQSLAPLSETCDDRNTTNGDGCSSLCKTEARPNASVSVTMPASADRATGKVDVVLTIKNTSTVTIPAANAIYRYNPAILKPSIAANAANCKVLTPGIINCQNFPLPAGATIDVPFFLGGTAVVQCNGIVSGNAQVSAAGDSNPADNITRPVNTTITCSQNAANAAVSLSVPESIVQGEHLTASVTAKNTSTVDMPYVTISYSFQSTLGVTPVIVTDPSGACQVVGRGSIICQNFPLAAGESKLFEFRLTNTDNVPCNIVALGLAQLAATNDSNPADNRTAYLNTRIQCGQREGLTVSMKSIGSTGTAVKNQKDVVLAGFEARAGTTSDIRMEKIEFTARAGASANNALNYTLWVDTDGDQIVDTKIQTGVSAQNNTITFSQMIGDGYFIPAGKSALFQVRADIASSLVTNTLAIDFLPGTTYIEAESVRTGRALQNIRTDGVCDVSPCEIVVTKVPPMVYTLISQGSLYVTQDTTPLRNRQLLGGTLTDPILRLSFRATGEPVDVTTLRIIVDKPGSVDRLELYTDDAANPFAFATTAGCGSFNVMAEPTFCANMQSRQLVIPEGSDVKVSIRPRMKSDDNGATSGQAVTAKILGRTFVNNLTGDEAVLARGVLSSMELVPNNGDTIPQGEVIIRPSLTGIGGVGPNSDIVGNPNVTSLSRIAAITNANPDANGSSVPTGVANIGQFKFTAARNSNSKNGLNKVTLGDLFFNVNATNVAIDNLSWRFYNKADSTVTKTCAAMTTAGTNITTPTVSGIFLVACTGLTASSVNTSIDMGGDQTFVLQANITNPQVNNTQSSVLQVSLQNFSNMAFTTFGTTQSHLRWVDDDAGTLGTGTTTESAFLWVEYPETVVNSTAYQS